MTKQQKLADALEAEKNRLPDVSVFGDKTNYKDYDLAISFLRTGIKPDNYERYDLTACVVEDLDTVCSDYEIV